MDLSAISIPLGYVFGRLGNFFNHELFGRLVDESEFGRSIGILVNGELRYPSQLLKHLWRALLSLCFCLWFGDMLKNRAV